MSKTASEIVDRALLLIDEVPTTFSTAATTETSIRDQALAILPEVARDLVKELPWELKEYLSELATFTYDTLSVGENQDNYVKKKIVIIPPNDYWEFVSLKMLAWSKPVTDYIMVGSEEYAIQNNPFTRGGKQNPVVALNNKYLSGGIRFECFSVDSEGSQLVEYFRYIKFSNVPDDTAGTTWPDELFDEVTKALATELQIIKSRIEEAVIMGEETKNAIEQHE